MYVALPLSSSLFLLFVTYVCYIFLRFIAEVGLHKDFVHMEDKSSFFCIYLQICFLRIFFLTHQNICKVIIIKIYACTAFIMLRGMFSKHHILVVASVNSIKVVFSVDF